eukprot:TRINITY_DN25672_c0_g1_i1.p2 TRINITY_DN25672_c0_g1~~TRINITY_DN25672_c0_g1_i1.p2  ORF type:complete len:124 (-),score=14.43 TRINITY_DN25672_c0_g1_i1:391-762(-)
MSLVDRDSGCMSVTCAQTSADREAGMVGPSFGVGFVLPSGVPTFCNVQVESCASALPSVPLPVVDMCGIVCHFSSKNARNAKGHFFAGGMDRSVLVNAAISVFAMGRSPRRTCVAGHASPGSQ